MKDDDQIPPEYGGSSPYRLGEHPYEVDLVNMIDVLQNNSRRCTSSVLGDPLDTMSAAPSSSLGVHGNEAENNYQRSTGFRAGQQLVQSLMPEKKTARRILSG